MINPTRTLRAAREEHDRLKGYLPEPEHCRWCGGAPTRPGLSHGLCKSCQTRMEVETMPDRMEFLAIAVGSGVPRPIAAALVRYTYDRVEPGPFLKAVLTNDLRLAVRYAAPDSLAALTPLMAVLHEHMPMGWYGTPGSVAGHLSEKRSVA